MDSHHSYKKKRKREFPKLESWKKNRTDTMDVLFGDVKTKTKSTMDYYRSIKWYMYEKNKRKLKRIEFKNRLPARTG